MPRSPERLRRFTQGQRWIHAGVGIFTGVCMVTAAMLYFGPISTLVGRRDLVELVHYSSGLLIPVPLLAGLVVSAAFRDDVRRLNRFLPGDWAWLRSPHRRGGWFPSGKFNAGQKLNSAFSLGAIVILLGTGLMMHYFSLFPDSIRTGATFVHDLTAAALAVVAAGHVWMALNDPEARRGLRTGTVTREWAEAEHALWAAEVTASSAAGEPDESGPKDPGAAPPARS